MPVLGGIFFYNDPVLGDVAKKINPDFKFKTNNSDAKRTSN